MLEDDAQIVANIVDGDCVPKIANFALFPRRCLGDCVPGITNIASFPNRCLGCRWQLSKMNLISKLFTSFSSVSTSWEASSLQQINHLGASFATDQTAEPCH
jgi:hypothetical protein